MTNEIILPKWEANTSLWIIATSLRQAVFNTQAQAARYFGVTSSSISRYEAYDSSGTGLKPPFGYLAALAELVEQGISIEGGDTEGTRQHLVQQLERIHKR